MRLNIYLSISVLCAGALGRLQFSNPAPSTSATATTSLAAVTREHEQLTQPFAENALDASRTSPKPTPVADADVWAALRPAVAAAAAAVAETPGRPPPYVPIVTPAPNQDEVLAKQGYRQETYYECRSRDGAASTHCGWHIPIVRSAATAVTAAATPASTAAVVTAVGCLAFVFVLGMI